MTQLGLTAEDGLAQAWFAHPNGRVCGGATAINESLKYVWWLRPFAYLYPIPGIRQLQDHVYRWVADNRHRLPGSTDTCQLPTNQQRSE